MEAAERIASAGEFMLSDIRRQPETLLAVLQRGDEIRRFAERHLTPAENGSLFAFGSGDGWFAARAALRGDRRGRAVSSLDFLLDVAPGLGGDDRALAISMSGNVDRSLEGAQAALRSGAGLALLTNGSGGRLGAVGMPCLSLDIPDLAPFLCGTSTYTASLAAIRLMRDPSTADSLEAALPRFPSLLSEADTLFNGNSDLAGAPGVRLLGTGSSLATADYGAAKCVEVTTVPSWSDDLEEFAHRQYWSMKRREIVVLLPVDEASARFADAAAEALSGLAVTVSLEPEGADVPSAVHRLRLPGGRDAAALTQAVALQVFAYRLGLANGTDPDRRLHLKDDAERFAASRRLTRRSLLGTGQ